MKKTLDELKVCKLFNNFGFNPISNCHQKPFVVLAENFIKNSQHYFILFNDYKLGILKNNFETFFFHSTNLDFPGYIADSHTIDKDTNLTEHVIKFIDNNKYLILLADTSYWNDNNTKNEEAHPHWTLVKGYDTDRKEFIVIDTDESKLYDIANEIVFIEKSVAEEDFIRRYTNILRFDWIKKNNTLNHDKVFAYKIVENSSVCNHIPMETIFSQYKSYLRELIEMLPEYEKKYMEEVSMILCHNGELPKNAKEMAGFFDWRYDTLSRHRWSLKFQRKYFDIAMRDYSSKQQLLDLFDISIKKYDGTFGKICKSVLTKTIDDINIQKLMHEISKNEQLLYNHIIKLLDNSQFVENTEREFPEIIPIN